MKKALLPTSYEETGPNQEVGVAGSPRTPLPSKPGRFDSDYLHQVSGPNAAQTARGPDQQLRDLAPKL
jgi:hypothetical protein